jgi:hypothetical protein
VVFWLNIDPAEDWHAKAKKVERQQASGAKLASKAKSLKIVALTREKVGAVGKDTRDGQAESKPVAKAPVTVVVCFNSERDGERASEAKLAAKATSLEAVALTREKVGGGS